MTASVISSLGLPKMIDRLATALVACLFLGSAVSAETDKVRLGQHFYYSADQRYSEIASYI